MQFVKKKKPFSFYLISALGTVLVGLVQIDQC